MHHLSFDSHAGLIIATCLAMVSVGVAWRRKIDLPFLAGSMGAGGLVCLALAAGEPVRWRGTPREVGVWVDLSPSTRTADFRQRERLERRVAQLLGKIPYRLHFFADGEAIAPPDDARTLADVACEQTRLPTVSAEAVVLFSDARLALPPTPLPPTYPVLDPALDEAPDAAVTDLSPGDGKTALITVRNAGPPRELLISTTEPQSVGRGTFHFQAPFPASGSLSVQLAGGDPWPENDALQLDPPPPEKLQRWWIGGAAPPGAGEWVSLSPTSLPDTLGPYLNTSLIVIDNLPASGIDPLRQALLRQYVERLGGNLLWVDRGGAYASADQGTPLDAIVPLTLHPPRPLAQWIILTDGSGSMADAATAGRSRWQVATGAIAALLPHLPPGDRVDVGSFARTITWWTRGRAARDVMAMVLPPAEVVPNGPTNLEPALRSVAAESADLPRNLLIISDGEVGFDDLPSLIATLRDHRIHPHVLAIGNGSGLPLLRRLADETGGSLVQELDPARWTQAALQLLDAAEPQPFSTEPLQVHFRDELSTLPDRTVAGRHVLWLKQGAAVLADGAIPDRAPLPLAARWQAGAGQVLATAFSPQEAELARMVSLLARSPRDPRFTLSWESGRNLRVDLDAVDGQAYLNGLKPALRLWSGADGRTSSTPLQQTGPGHYRASIPAPRSASIAGVEVDGRMLEQRSIAGRYAPEFDQIGNDREAMTRLASDTGGQVILPTQQTPIEFRVAPRRTPLTAWVAMAGVVLIGAGLVAWRRG